MAKFNINEMKSSLENKVNELLDKIAEMEQNINLSENTVRTQKQAKTHEAHNLLIMLQLLRNMSNEGDIETELPDDVAKWFTSTTTLTEDRKRGSIIFKDGDDLIKVMDEHPNLNYAKLKKMVIDQGFMIDGHTVRK